MKTFEEFEKQFEKLPYLRIVNKYFEETFEMPDPWQPLDLYNLGTDLLPLQSFRSTVELELSATRFLKRNLRLSADRGFFPTGAFFLSSVFWEKSGFTWAVQDFDDDIIGSVDFSKRIVFASTDHIEQLMSGSTQARFDLSYLIAMVLWHQETCKGLYITVKKWDLALHEITVAGRLASNLLSVQTARLVHAVHMNSMKMNIWLNRFSDMSHIARSIKVPYAEFRNRRTYLESLGMRMPVSVTAV